MLLRNKWQPSGELHLGEENKEGSHRSGRRASRGRIVGNPNVKSIPAHSLIITLTAKGKASVYLQSG